MRRDVRILLVGDDQFGKSTLVTSLIKETFVPNIQHVVPEVIIPPEVTGDNVTTYIVDSSSRLENRSQLEVEIRKADVICIVYAVNVPETFERIPSFWLPYIRSLGRNVPVVLVGNKIDLRGRDNLTNERLKMEVMPIMDEFKEVETCVECSAKELLNVSEVFYFAQKAVLHPTAPLYDSREHVMKPACIEALKRIFKLCDIDKDGVLNDEELNEFQKKCFNSPLQQQELEGIKNVVRENSTNGVDENGLTETGFLFLHKLFIQRGRLETTWSVLRKFGYGDDLSLREDFLYPQLNVFPDCTFELSSDGYKFFVDTFEAYDKDQDGALNNDELNNLFSTSPGNPWTENFPESTLTNNLNSITLQGFLAQWSMTTLLSYKTTLAYLAYLGYNGDTTSALKIIRPKKIGKKIGKVQKDVLLCYVFGSPGSGKTALLRGLVNKSFENNHIPTINSYCAVNSVEVEGVEKYLVMQEFGKNNEAEILKDRQKLDLADVIVFVYDSSDVNSFAYIAGLRTQYNLDEYPIIYVSTKCDSDLVQQRYEVQPDVYCRKLGLAVPICVSVKSNEMADLYNLIAGVAMNPQIAIVQNNKDTSSFNTIKYLKYTAVAGGIIAIGYLSYKLITTRIHQNDKINIETSPVNPTATASSAATAVVVDETAKATTEATSKATTNIIMESTSKIIKQKKVMK
jgi:Ras family protein T1